MSEFVRKIRKLFLVLCWIWGIGGAAVLVYGIVLASRNPEVYGGAWWSIVLVIFWTVVPILIVQLIRWLLPHEKKGRTVEGGSK